MEKIQRKCGEVVENGKYMGYIIRGDFEKYIDRFKNQCACEFIFLSEEYRDLSFEPTITEFRKFKSKYPANTYVRIPVKIDLKEGEKYKRGIVECEEDESDGYVVFSKRDLNDYHPEARYKPSEDRVFLCKHLCRNAISEYNLVLDCELYSMCVAERDENGHVVQLHYFPYTPMSYEEFVEYAKNECKFKDDIECAELFSKFITK